MGNAKKTVLITGASSGFGEACAHQYAKEGCRLILMARSFDRLEALKSKLEQDAKGESVVLIRKLDVQDRCDVEQTITDLPTEFANIDVLVNNAGLALGTESVEQSELTDWDTMVDTNIKGLLYMTRVVLRGMVARKCGHIINIGSIAGNWPHPRGGVYGASKAFVQQFSRNMRADLMGKNIRVSNIEPGAAATNYWNVRFKGDSEKAESIYAGTKALTAEDIAQIICWTSGLPEHVNVNTLEVMSVCQSWGPFAIYRAEEEIGD